MFAIDVLVPATLYFRESVRPMMMFQDIQKRKVGEAFGKKYFFD